MMRFLAVLLLAAIPMLAQLKGTINGDVVDSTGASVPGAKVKIASAAIGFEREAVTSQDALRRKLKAHGFEATQATISRDIKDLGLVKRAIDGAYQQPGVNGGGPSRTPMSALEHTAAEFLRTVARVKQLVVVRTGPGVQRGDAGREVDHDPVPEPGRRRGVGVEAGHAVGPRSLRRTRPAEPRRDVPAAGRVVHEAQGHRRAVRHIGAGDRERAHGREQLVGVRRGRSVKAHRGLLSDGRTR